MANDFNIHLHFAQSFALSALHNLMNAQYGRSNSIPASEKQNLAWARGSFERALKAIDALEKERANPGTRVETDYLPDEEDKPDAEAAHAE